MSEPEHVKKFREKYPEIDVFEIDNPEFLARIAEDMDQDTERANEDARLLAELGEAQFQSWSHWRSGIQESDAWLKRAGELSTTISGLCEALAAHRSKDPKP